MTFRSEYHTIQKHSVESANVMMRIPATLALGIAKRLTLLKNMHRKLGYIKKGWGEWWDRKELVTVFKY